MPGPKLPPTSDAVASSTGPVGEIHEDLVSLAGCDQQISRFHRSSKIASVSSDDEECPPVAEAKVEGACIRRVQEAQAHEAGGHSCGGTNGPIDEQRVARNPWIMSIMPGS